VDTKWGLMSESNAAQTITRTSSTLAPYGYSIEDYVTVGEPVVYGEREVDQRPGQSVVFVDTARTSSAICGWEHLNQLEMSTGDVLLSVDVPNELTRALLPTLLFNNFIGRFVNLVTTFDVFDGFKFPEPPKGRPFLVSVKPPIEAPPLALDLDDF